MRFFTILNDIFHEREGYYRQAGVGAPITRPANAYFGSIRPDNYVTFLDPFQSTEDFKNDLKGIFIKTLTTWMLSKYYYIQTLYELGLTAIHLLSFSPTEASRHFDKTVDAFIRAAFYDFIVIGVAITETLSFAIRCTMTLGTGLYRVGENLSNMASPLLNKQTETDNSETSAAFAM